MKKIVRLTERDLTNLVKRVISEQLVGLDVLNEFETELISTKRKISNLVNQQKINYKSSDLDGHLFNIIYEFDDVVNRYLKSIKDVGQGKIYIPCKESQNFLCRSK